MIPVDSLGIQIEAEAKSAAASLDNLIGKMDRLNASLTRVSGTGMTSLATGVNRLVSAMDRMKTINAADFTRLAKNMSKISAIDNGKIRAVAVSFSGLTKSLNGLAGTTVSDNAAKIGSLAKGIAQLGYKSSTKAITNIPLLANAMEDLIRRMSKLPAVSQNLINFTNALAKLSRTGASAGSAANSLSKSINTYSSSANKGTKSTFNLASAIGKIYATYWMLFRAFNTLKSAIDISSNLTEVQNVVDVTFGKYSDLVEKMSETSITDFGMSELTVKQISSRFQAMGTAMGFAQGKMAEMSVDLTALAADMASFYNVEQSAVAEDLESIFTGQTRPLRQYGLDLTEATLKEWALKNGLDANIKSMSQAEKTMLRYQYVLANTGAAQGDFLRTSNTWANQVRILKQNFEQLGSVVGGTLINMLKPLVSALNTVIAKFTEFATAVSNSLGKIFGWTYENSTGGGLVQDYEDAAGASDDLASGTGKAADNAKRLKSYLLGIDELNVLEADKGDSSGSGGSGGGASSGLGGAVDAATGGQWVKTESLFEQYESELDSLNKLGEFIGQKLTNVLTGIDWDSIYEGAKGFGTGLAEFLNGLISPELFGAVGSTIASALNTAIYSVLSFGQEFNFYEFGNSIATGISDFFETFDFGALAESLNVWIDDLKYFIAGFLDGLRWEDIVGAAGDFLGELEIDTLKIVIGAVTFRFAKPFLTTALASLGTLLESALGGSAVVTGLGVAGLGITITATLDFVLASLTKPDEVEVGDYQYWRNEQINATEYVDSESFINSFKIIGDSFNSIFGTPEENQNRISATEYVDSQSFIDVFNMIGSSFIENFKPVGLTIGGGFIQDGSIASELDDEWSLAQIFWDGKKKLSEIKTKIESIKSNLSEKWDLAKKFWSDKDVLEEVKTTYEEFKEKIKEQWENSLLYWKGKEVLSQVKTTYESFRTKIKEKWDSAVDYWNNVKEELSEIKAKYEDFKSKVREKWSEVITYWSEKTGLSEVKTTYESIKEKIEGKWNEALTWWKNNAKLPKLNLDFGLSVDSLKKSLNVAIGWINTHIIGALNKLSIKIGPLKDLFGNVIFEQKTIGFNIKPIQGFETGGFPEPASLFYAGENGVPELLGTVGGRTAVAGGAEITGIREAVYSTGQTEASLLVTAIGLLREIADKDMSVNIGDREIAKASNRGNAMLGRQLITV